MGDSITRDELMEAIFKAWNDMIPKFLKTHVGSMKDKIYDVVVGKSNATT